MGPARRFGAYRTLAPHLGPTRPFLCILNFDQEELDQPMIAFKQSARSDFDVHARQATSIHCQRIQAQSGTGLAFSGGDGIYQVLDRDRDAELQR
jgi:hypothetical protein